MKSAHKNIKEPNWQLLAYMVRNQSEHTQNELSSTLGVPKHMIYRLMRDDNFSYRPKWSDGERLRRYALEVLTAEQLERCGVPVA